MIVDLQHARDPRAIQPRHRAQRAMKWIAAVADLIIARSGSTVPSLTLSTADYDALASDHPGVTELRWGRIRLRRLPDPDHSIIC